MIGIVCANPSWTDIAIAQTCVAVVTLVKTTFAPPFSSVTLLDTRLVNGLQQSRLFRVACVYRTSLAMKVAGKRVGDVPVRNKSYILNSRNPLVKSRIQCRVVLEALAVLGSMMD